MKTAGALIGGLVALALIYWMRPLSPAAVALLALLCVGAGTVIGNALRRKKPNGAKQ
jgi:hypothetical protein